MTTALITGATSGIGRAMVLALDGAGYDVYAVARSEAGFNTLRSARPRIVPITLDVADREAVEAAVGGLLIDVLVNNAGIMPPLCPFADVALADIDRVLGVNLSAALVLGALARAMPGRILAEGAGALWNIHMSVRPAAGAEGRRAEVLMFNAGGMGARTGLDCLSATAFPSAISQGTVPSRFVRRSRPRPPCRIRRSLRSNLSAVGSASLAIPTTGPSEFWDCPETLADSSRDDEGVFGQGRRTAA